jgi:hypothetical protein
MLQSARESWTELFEVLVQYIWLKCLYKLQIE